MFTKINFLHNKYWDYSRHWHPQSEPYASGEQLQQVLFDGWELDKVAFKTTHPLKTSGRLIVFYVVTVLKVGEKRHIPVLVNPFVERLLVENNVQLINVERHHPRKIKADAELTQEAGAIAMDDEVYLARIR
ncbi:MAG: hypothetical protein RLP44_07110 [Aggregatilineales bacterium]